VEDRSKDSPEMCSRDLRALGRGWRTEARMDRGSREVEGLGHRRKGWRSRGSRGGVVEVAFLDIYIG